MKGLPKMWYLRARVDWERNEARVSKWTARLGNPRLAPLVGLMLARLSPLASLLHVLVIQLDRERVRPRRRDRVRRLVRSVVVVDHLQVVKVRLVLESGREWQPAGRHVLAKFILPHRGESRGNAALTHTTTTWTEGLAELGLVVGHGDVVQAARGAAGRERHACRHLQVVYTCERHTHVHVREQRAACFHIYTGGWFSAACFEKAGSPACASGAHSRQQRAYPPSLCARSGRRSTTPQPAHPPRAAGTRT